MDEWEQKEKSFKMVKQMNDKPPKQWRRINNDNSTIKSNPLLKKLKLYT